MQKIKRKNGLLFFFGDGNVSRPITKLHLLFLLINIIAFGAYASPSMSGWTGLSHTEIPGKEVFYGHSGYRAFIGEDFAFLGINASQQEHVVRGRVFDSQGNPIAGASIVLKSASQTGATTDANGMYELRAPSNAVLIFSAVGFLAQEIIVGGRTAIDVTLAFDDTKLNEVVVVGYGKQKKSHLTGAVSTVSVQDNLQGRPIADVGRAIQGAAPGMNIVVPSGEVGLNPIIRIRGQIGSLNGGSAPLILLDNVEIPSIQLVNPDDIEAISVLKDAASTSIYGAKAAFGVILITTKQGGKKDRVNVNYSNNFSFQNPWKEIEMSGSNAIRYNLDAYLRQGTTVIPARFSSDQASYERILEWEAKYGGVLGVNDPLVYGRDWYFDPAGNRKYGVRLYDPMDYLFKDWTPSQQHNFSVGGTSGKTSFNIGLGALNQSGMMAPAKVDAFKRYNASVRVSTEVNKFFTARAGAMFSQADKQYPFVSESATTDVWYWVYRWNQLYPHGFDETGDPLRGPWYEAKQANTASRKTNFTNLNLGATLDFTKNWKAEIDYSFSNDEYIFTLPGSHFTARDINVNGVLKYDENGNDVYVNKDGQVVSGADPGAMRAYELPLATYPTVGAGADYYRRESSNAYRHTLNAYTTYDLDVKDDHSFRMMLGVNRVTYNSASSWSRRDGLIDPINPQFAYTVGLQTAGGGASWEGQLGYFSRLNYAYKDKYLFEANLRYDGTSKFPTDMRWRWFPSVSAGWVLSKENFMKFSAPAIDFLKARASWGVIGDQSVQPGLFLPSMSMTQDRWVGGNGQLANVVGTPSAVSQSITWQDITSLNLGLDVRLLKNKVGVTFDWYRRETENMIVPSPGVSPAYGASAPLGNFGSLRTNGWELELDFNHRFNNGLGFNVKGNLSDAVTTITKYGTTKSIDNWYVGKKYGEIWGYVTDRLYQYDDFVLDGNGAPQLITLTANESAKYAGSRANQLKPGHNGEKPVYQAGLQNSSNFFFGPGDVKFVDLDGDGELTPGNRLIDDHGDLRVIGNSTPRYIYGFRLGLDFKGVDFAVFFQGVGKRELWPVGRLAIAGFNPAEGATPSAIADNYWTKDNPNAFYPAAYHQNQSNTTNNYQQQTRYLLDMSYTRIKNISLGYSLPRSILSRVGLTSTRIYTSLENFFTWDKLGRLPIDPEEILGVLGDGGVGVTSSNQLGVKAPLFKSISFGLQLNF